ncbi:MAG TPA: hypothetical protein PLP27_05295 [Crocinitomicaceae bacterium]|nr:hypothetical protein [Crocinitomicaceae bacterium]
MRKIIVLFAFFLSFQTVLVAQQKLNLTNAVVVGLFDRKEERFEMEIFMSELLAENKIKTKASLNYLKEGADIVTFASDSVQNVMRNNGFDTYVLVCVRGYETTFKPATFKYSLVEELKLGHLFPIYRDETSNVTFEFKIYRGSEMIGYNLLKVSTPSKEGLKKKLRKKMTKLIKKNW